MSTDNTKSEFLRMALEAGFMLSTAYGQATNKLMPVSDADTVVNFGNKCFQMGLEEAAIIAERTGCGCVDKPTNGHWPDCPIAVAQRIRERISK